MHVTFSFVFAFDRNFKILILWNSRRDRLVITANVSSTNQLEPGSDLNRSLYFEECMTCQLCSIKLSATWQTSSLVMNLLSAVTYPRQKKYQ
jgi:hypothetical protein